jgi:hypothetical protein
MEFKQNNKCIFNSIRVYEVQEQETHLRSAQTENADKMYSGYV